MRKLSKILPILVTLFIIGGTSICLFSGTPTVAPSSKPAQMDIYGTRSVDEMFWRAMSDAFYAIRTEAIGYLFWNRDTVIVTLEGADTDTALFYLPSSRGYFTVWAIADTAGSHTVTTIDSITITYEPGLDSTTVIGTADLEVQGFTDLCPTAEVAYWAPLNPTPTEYFYFYITHTNADAVEDTFQVMLIMERQ